VLDWQPFYGFLFPSTVIRHTVSTRAMSELLNLVGLGTGVVLYAMLLTMVLRRDRAADGRTIDPLLLATALLGLTWNLTALPAYELPKLGIRTSFVVLTALGFSALGFLPAVVVQSVLRGAEHSIRGRERRAVAFSAYAISGIAAFLHARAISLAMPVPSFVAMRLLTYAYIGLALPVAMVTRGQPGARRALWVAALSIFAVSALHLSQVHQGDAAWPVELLGHHASVPLALAILYQDYPFALADLFLKRALTLLVLVAAAFLSVTALHASSVAAPLGGAREVGSLVVLWVGTALLYPKVRDGIATFVDTVVLDRPDYAQLIADVVRCARGEQDIAPMLDRTCELLAPALSARTVTWRELSSADASAGPDSVAAQSASVEIPVAETPQYLLQVRGLTGGRRLLSGDYAALHSIASVLGRRIDAIRLTRERYARRLQEHEMSKLATEAELRALRSQINPHFLFNALTTIGYLIQTAPERALQTLLRLTSLLRGVLRSEGEFTTLGRELEIIESYLDIEHARFEQRLSVRIDVPQSLRHLQILPLSLQPIVENAVKHGIAPKREGGEVSCVAHLDDSNIVSPTLVVVVRDSGVGASEAELRRGRAAGVGLSNVERRLAAQYGASASLSIVSARGLGTTVEIRVPAHQKPSGRILPMPTGRSVS
jgi:two-component system, LytTR family, sensor kinase